MPASVLERFAQCTTCGFEFDRAKLTTLKSRVPTPPPLPFEMGDVRTAHGTPRVCPECGTPTAARLCPSCQTLTLLTERADPLVARVLDLKYKVKARIGCGGFGTVYRATQLALGRDVAIKVIRSDWKDDPEMVRRFMREAKLVARLKHPNTIQVFDFGQSDDGEFYLAMELLEGETVTARLVRVRRFAPDDAARLLSSVAGALVEAHCHTIVHRDLKPDNIFLHRAAGVPEVVKVLDFGIAKVAEATGSLFQTGNAGPVGTPLYMAPEQIRSEVVDKRTDLYALGVILYELLAGRPPFVAPSQGQVFQLHLTTEPPELPWDIPRALRNLCMRLLAKSPDDRPASAEEVLEVLETTPTVPWAPLPGDKTKASH